jgi:hypothetical protein
MNANETSCRDTARDTQDVQSTLDVNVSVVADLEVHGQRILVDQKFKEILADAWLTIDDLRKVAFAVVEWLRKAGWHVPQDQTLLLVDQVSNPPDLLFVYTRGQPDGGTSVMPLAVINADSRLLEKQVHDVRRLCGHGTKREKLNILKTSLRSTVGMQLAHELTHAFGVHLRNPLFKELPIRELEVLTDACAFLSCRSFIGEAAYLGVYYLQNELKKRGGGITLKSIRDLAKNITSLATREDPANNRAASEPPLRLRSGR